jgi:N-methylhydantoinase A/oxoprolinase/acetone carboxylase beta subunit
MPDVLSVGIGGGSRVRGDSDPTIGPDSVGHELTERALVFGGDTLTATDIVVAAGRADIGDASLVRHLDPKLVTGAIERIAHDVAEIVDRMRTSAEPVPVVIVGGGSVLIPDALPSFGEVHRPDHFAVANAIGAAIAQVGGEVDRIFAIGRQSRDEVLDQAKAEAMDQAVAAGARPGSVQIVEVEEVPIAYLPGNAVRVRVKAVGDLEFAATGGAG